MASIASILDQAVIQINAWSRFADDFKTPFRPEPGSQTCQIASDSDPHFAFNLDPSSGTVWSLSTSCIGGTRARSAAPQALRGAEGRGRSLCMTWVSARVSPGQHWPTEGNTDETSEGSRLDAKNTPQGVIIASEFTQRIATMHHRSRG
jgi:hypothetical protein